MALPALLGIGSLLLGGAQMIGGLAGGPSGEIPRHTVSPELRKAQLRGEELAKQGMTAAERAAYGQALAQARQTGFQRAMDVSGGNLSQALAAGLAAQRLNAENQIAIQDAQLRRQNVAQANRLAGQMQEQRNLITQADRQRWLQQEMAAGQAIGGGLTNMTNALNLGMITAGKFGDGVFGLGNLFGGGAGATGSEYESP